jgi:mono/diheme cytochrome c family protein
MSRDTCSLLILAAAGLTAAMFGCGGGEESSGGKTPSATTTAPAVEPAAAQPAAAGADAQAVREANEIFALRCVACHGQQGAGDGPGSAALTPKPRNFQDPAWQSSVSDEHLSAIVLMGGVAVGMSPTMPGNPDLQAKPQVVQALVAHIRSLARP